MRPCGRRRRHGVTAWWEGTAEATGLPGACADLVFCAQAFHWFRREEAKAALRAAEWFIALTWNLRRTTGSEFAEGVERLCWDAARDYSARVRSGTEETVDSIQDLFAPAEVRLFETAHGQRLDWPALLGRLLSASYVPQGLALRRRHGNCLTARSRAGSSR